MTIKSLALLTALLVVSALNSGAQQLEPEAVVLVTTGDYLARPGDSATMAEKLARYGAKRKAVEIAGRYFAIKGLIASYDKQKEEVYSLATTEIQSKILEESWLPSGKLRRYKVRMECRIDPADLVQAQVRAEQIEKAAADDTLREELEPPVRSQLDPAYDVAKAYRYFRTGQWRPASIYLDRLERKYPHWDEIFMAKAIAFYALQEPIRMKEALEQACAFESRRACEDLESLKKVHDLDLKP